MSSPMALPSSNHPEVTTLWKILGVVAFIGAITLLRIPLRATIATIGILHRLPLADSTAATPAVGRLAGGCLWASTYWPGRAACLELSLATVIAAALTSRRLHWCLGARFDPPATHAWAQTVDGTPVGEPADLGWPWTTALRV
ncbi:lasso peptide biosynthesis B2 protein [Nocardiopsis sp. NPDC049922]|uniref:lasso peptide biosynthesis B2 protein n=1 Tax=Nocardiopsis sp. NPDC049922 TaxID=3155157 RepID=UPI00340953F8